MRELINYTDEVRMWKSGRKEGTVIAIIEAKSDERFFKKFFNTNTVFFPVDGFQNVINVIADIEKDVAGILGIIDADFRNYTGEKLTSENLFMTDFHDIEMMTIASNVWHEVVSYYSQTEKLVKFEQTNRKSLREYLLEIAKPIADIRFLNHQHNLGLTFKTRSKDKYIWLDYGKFIDEKKFNIVHKQLLKVVEDKSQKLHFFKRNPHLETELANLAKIACSLYQFCNGHDVMNILALALKKMIGKTDISGQELESYFIVAYRMEDFSQTNLYEQLKKWETVNTPFLLFPFKIENK